MRRVRRRHLQEVLPVQARAVLVRLLLPCPFLVLPCNGYGAARDLAFLPNSQRNLSLPLCDLVVGAGNRTGILASAWCSLVRESNFHNHGLVSCKIGVPGE